MIRSWHPIIVNLLIQHFRILGVGLPPSFLRRLIESCNVKYMQFVTLPVQSGYFHDEKHFFFFGACLYPVIGNALGGLPPRYYWHTQECLAMDREGLYYLAAVAAF